MSRASAASTVFTAIADPVRRTMLLALRDGAQSAGELIGPLDISQSAASQHLAVLRRARLVVARRDGRRQIYRVNPTPLYEVECWIRHFDKFWDDKLAGRGRYLAKQKGAQR